MRFKTGILGGAAALLLATGLTGVALAETPKPSATTTPSAGPVKVSPSASPQVQEPAPAKPSDAEPSYTG